ncbi:MAG: nitroreductase family protein [Candidatus Bathyarchaeota archaeon]
MSLNILEVIKNRRSIKEYSSKGVSKETLFRVLEACRWAPSAHNAQPWRFIVIRDPIVKQRLAEEMAGRWETDLDGDRIPLKKRKSLIGASIKQFSGAPVIVIACLTMEDMDKYPDKNRKKIEYLMAVQSVASAVNNILLAAHSADLAACWFCAPLFCPDAVRKTLKIPERMEPQALITIGYSAKKLDPPLRRALKDIIHEEYWRA